MRAQNCKLKHHPVLPVAVGSSDNIALTASNVLLSQFSALEERKRAPKVTKASTTLYFFLQLTIFKPCVDQILDAGQQLLPVLLNYLFDLSPRARAQLLDLLVVDGGPEIAVDKDNADKKE